MGNKLKKKHLVTHLVFILSQGISEQFHFLSFIIKNIC